MRTSVVIAVAGVLVLAAGGAYYGHEVYLQRQFRAGLDQTLASLPAGTTATYKDAHYSVVSKQAVVTGLTLHGLIAGPSPQPIEVTIDSIETTNPNLDFARAWADAAAHAAALTPQTAFAVADAITVKGVIVHSALISGATESARIDKLRLYPWALLHAGMPSWTQLQASLAPRSEPPSLADLQPLLRAQATVLLAVAYDTYEVRAAKFTETLPEIDIAYDVHKMTGSGFDRGVIKQAAGEGIIFHGNKIGTLSVDRVTMGATDLRAPMIRLVNGEAASAALLDAIAIGRVEYDGITIQPPDKPSMHIGSFSVGPIAFAKGMPVSGNLAWNDISVPQSLVTDANAREAFTQLGLETITTSFALSYDWDVAAQHASLHDTMLKGQRTRHDHHRRRPDQCRCKRRRVDPGTIGPRQAAVRGRLPRGTPAAHGGDNGQHRSHGLPPADRGPGASTSHGGRRGQPAACRRGASSRRFHHLTALAHDRALAEDAGSLHGFHECGGGAGSVCRQGRPGRLGQPAVSPAGPRTAT
jgi:hypothetical protein